MKTILIGLGNPILGDDSAGWRVVELVQRSPNYPKEMVSHCMSVGGLALMESLIGFDRAILVDTIWTGRNQPGTIAYFPLTALESQDLGYSNSSHDTTIQNALIVGKKLGVELPKNIDVVSIEAIPTDVFSEDLSPDIQLAIPKAVTLIEELIQ